MTLIKVTNKQTGNFVGTSKGVLRAMFHLTDAKIKEIESGVMHENQYYKFERMEN